MKSIDLYIVKLDNCLQKYCKPLYDEFLEPLGDASIKSILDKWNMNDPLLFSIYRWKGGMEYDGTGNADSLSFNLIGTIPSLKYAEQVLAEGQKHMGWRATQFPLICSFSGDFVLYETDKNRSDYQCLYLVSPTMGYVDIQPKYFDSVFSMIDTIVLNFETGVFRYEDMYLEVDYDLNEINSADMNPDSDYWKN